MKKALKITLIAVFWVGVWYLLSFIHALYFKLDLNNNFLFPYPHQVIKKLFELLGTSKYYLSTLSSLARISISTFVAIIVGFGSAIVAARFNFVNDLLKPFLATVKSVPVTVFVFILYIIFYRYIALTSMIITFLIVYPIVFANIYEGIRNINKDLKEVCSVYKIPVSKRLKSLYLPSVMPYFVSALTTSIGLAWKAGIAAEALCPPDNSMGLHISYAKLYIENDELFAWALTLVLINIFLEILFKKLINIAFKRWLPNEVKYENN